MNNSRPQGRLNQVWRRRQCISCGAVLTTHESIDYSQSLTVRSKDKQLRPFSRDKLFLSIYRSCKHRKTAVEDAAALTATVISVIAPQSESGVIDTILLNHAACAALKRFDKAAAVQYEAFHPSV